MPFPEADSGVFYSLPLSSPPVANKKTDVWFFVTSKRMIYFYPKMLHPFI